MANINDIDSLFTLIDQSPNDYKEFYHEKNGLHALDKWSYLKNIQLENPDEEGISIFENRPKSSSEGSPINSSISLPDNEVPLKDPTVNPRLMSSSGVSPVVPEFVVTPPPMVRTFSSPVVDTTSNLPPVKNVVEPVKSKFEEPIDTFTPEPLESFQAAEPLSPQIYNPVAPNPPKVFSTTDIPTVPSFSSKFISSVNPTTATSFSSGFMRPTLNTPPVINTPPVNTAPPVINTPPVATPEVQPSFLPPRFTQAPGSANAESNPEQASDESKNPLNTIFSRLEQK